MAQIVAIVGRPNVGKSTLYNRLIGEQEAIIDDISGVTRDRKYGSCEWNGKTFTVIDTGGFVHGSDDVFEKAIRNQVKIAIDEANIILFMVDVTTGITDLDEEVARMLRKTEKDVFVIVNKADNPNRLLAANEFYSLGFENTFFLSAISGSGTGEILDAIAERIEFQEETEEEETLPRFAIIGQPNVGKSSLTNALLGFERNIVTEIAGTTRDSIHSHYNQFGKEFLLIDTAGLRKKGKVHEDLEFYSVIRAIRAVEEADVCLLMIDAETGIEAQDMQIFQLAVRRRKGVVILVNKWDLVEKETNTAKEVEDRIKQKLAPFNDVPVVFISATEKTRIFKAIEVAMDVYERRNQKIRTPELNTWLEEVTTAHPPPSHRGKFVKIKYGNQLPLAYPAFAFFCNYPSAVKGSYKNYLENQLRKRYNFTGVPVAIYFREK
ncbi:MAG TPA: ribosome biogenesis GTPase Der [Saprospiraceae bacterium]|nr:ribosome biogenesis GTPase Der [Saprospiraceae bacterium]MCB9270437.1 ribosome biogenesis GTPase Der [Lewinellaceae bacterium]HPG07441.1 ribosome biogenesis GTPase Der [Saprospiraceae bacterium]HQU52623.1 ribosome biogenesis GTPase Der [Saprospiraceae bacterium]HRV84949.1 ribosome biogenesis GTPase Der [Saprospiraceae bacterium]